MTEKKSPAARRLVQVRATISHGDLRPGQRVTVDADDPYMATLIAKDVLVVERPVPERA